MKITEHTFCIGTICKSSDMHWQLHKKQQMKPSCPSTSPALKHGSPTSITVLLLSSMLFWFRSTSGHLQTNFPSNSIKKINRFGSGNHWILLFLPLKYAPGICLSMVTVSPTVQQNESLLQCCLPEISFQLWLGLLSGCAQNISEYHPKLKVEHVRTRSFNVMM